MFEKVKNKAKSC